jgi:hypothetical protein
LYAVINNRQGTARDRTLIMLSLLRGLGMTARLVQQLCPLSFKIQKVNFLFFINGQKERNQLTVTDSAEFRDTKGNKKEFYITGQKERK